MSKKPTYEELEQRIKALEKSESERKQAENKLKESESRFRELVNTINSGVAVYKVINDGKSGSDYIIEDFNEFALSHEGMLKEDVIGKSLKDIRPNINDFGIIDVFRKVWKSGKSEFYPAKIYIDDNFANYYENRVFKLSSGEIVAVFDDVTENKRAEEELKENESRLAIAQEIGLLGTWTLDTTSDVLEWTDQNYKIFGVKTGTPMTSERFFKIIHPDDRDYVSEKWAAGMRGEEYDIEHRLLIKGKVKWVREKAIVKFDEDGKAVSAVGITQDISEKKRAEEALIRSKEHAEGNAIQLNAILENSPTGFAINRISTGEVTYVNKSFTDIYHVPVKFCSTVSDFFEYVYGDQLDLCNKLLEDVKSGIPERMKWDVVPITDKKTKDIYYITAANIVLEELDLMISTVNDITSQINNENELRTAIEKVEESEALKRKMVSNIGDVIVIIDHEGINRYKSPNIEKLFGWKSEELVGNSAWDNVHPDDLDYSQRFIESLLSEPGKVGAIELRYMHKDGHYSWIEFKGSNMLNDPDIKGILGNYHDITARKEAEIEREKLQDQLRQSQKMESVGRLAGGVAHDYNNISSIILGYSELALDNVEKSDPLYGDLMEIRTAANRSADITQQLLAFARKQTIAPEVLDLNDTIGPMLKMLQRLIGEDIELIWIPGTEIRPIKIDPSQMNQIMANLCVNARDSITNMGRITVETQNINLDENYCADYEWAVPGEYIEISVSDDGCGMTPETRDKIFEPFFTTKGTDGTGLGLSTVYGIVKQNNGLINVYSEIKKGTTFRIYLPIHEGQTVKAHIEKSTELPLSSGETVLLVDDDDTILKIVKRILEKLGYAVLFSNSPVNAVKLAEDHAEKINLLITDVVMPEMNGRELSECLQSLYPDIKVLFMSGYTADIIENSGVLEEDVNFISKPFSNKDLAFKVREVLVDEICS